MNLRNLPSGLSDSAQCDARRTMIEQELGLDLSALAVDSERLGSANEKNCEQMFGHIRVPVGLAGPLHIHFSSDEKKSIYLPLATTEGALIASVNRGCKAASISGIQTHSRLCGITRSIALKAKTSTKAIGKITQYLYCSKRPNNSEGENNIC
jgi:hydroxymethylglutaryl-CoA reductase (NADPH)